MWRKLIWFLIPLVPAVAGAASTPLESVSLEGTAVTKEAVLEVAGLRIGAPVDKAAIEAACARLQESGIFQSIGFRYAPGPKRGFALTLTLADQGPLADAAIDIPGSDDGEVWRWLAARFPPFDRRVPGNDAAQRFLAREIERHLGTKLDGRRIVPRLESELQPRQRLIVSFQPETLPRIASMTFTGQREVSSEALASLLRPAVADRGYTERHFRRAMDLNLRPAFEERGMYRVRFLGIALRRVSVSEVAVEAAIEEGPKFTLGKVEFTGDKLPVESMLKAAGFQTGQLANWTEIQKSIYELEKPVRRTGYLRATARAGRVLHDSPPVLDLKIGFDLGPLFRFGELRMAGLSPALEDKVRAAWKLRPGDPFDYRYPEDFWPGFFRLVDARKFEKYAATVQEGDGENVMDFLLRFSLR